MIHVIKIENMKPLTSLTICRQLQLAFCFFSIIAMPRADAGLCQGLAIPAYFYPGQLWTTAVTAAPRTAITIMNPDSGAGTSKDSQYVTAVTAARAAGVKVLGCVYTSYGDRPLEAAKGEIDLYKSWYGADGIFLDETSSGIADFPYYKNLARYIRDE